MTNPYLAFAVILKSGLEGILNKEELPPAMEQNLYLLTAQERKEKNLNSLPSSLAESLVYFANSQLMFDLLGQDLMYKYYNSKSEEVYAFSTCVTDWERKTYL